jgi:serine/threonine protein kinase
MEPIFSSDDDESIQKKCIELMKENFQDISNPKSEYTFVAQLSGGKSGAIIEKVRHKETGKDVVLKTYKSEPYNPLDIDTDMGSRPLREIYTTCVMSGTKGFPIVYDFGILTENKSNYLYLISELVSGEPMSRVDMTVFSSQEKASILLQLLNLLFVAREKLGKFIHNDLHPDNIFIDATQFSGKIKFGEKKFMDSKPKVSIIDFDFSVSEKYSQDPNPRKKITLPMSVIQWINNIFNLTNVTKILARSSVGETEDLVIWNVYYIGLSMLELQSQEQDITEDDVNAVIDNAKLCDTLDNCLAHPYINQHMNHRRTVNRSSEPEFISSTTDERKMVEEHLNLIIDNMLQPLGLDSIGKSFIESYTNLNKVYNQIYKRNVPYEEVGFYLTLPVVSEKDKILKIDSCLTGRFGNIDVHVTLPDKIIIKLLLKDKKVDILFMSDDKDKTKGLKIKNVTNRTFFFSSLQRVLSFPFFYFINPIIHNVSVKSSEEVIGSTELKVNYSVTKLGMRDSTTMIPPSEDTFEEQVKNITSCIIPILLKNKHIFQKDVIYHAMIEEGSLITFGSPVTKEWADILEIINERDAKSLIERLFT